MPTLDPLLLVTAALGVARITSLLVFDDLLEPLRHRVFKWSPPPDDDNRGHFYQYEYPVRGKSEYGEPFVYHDPGFIGSLLACYHCVGVWVTIAAYAALQLAESQAIVVLTVAALAQLSEIIIAASRRQYGS